MAGGAVLTMTGKDHGLLFETSGRRESLFDRVARNILINHCPDTSVRFWEGVGRCLSGVSHFLGYQVGDSSGTLSGARDGAPVDCGSFGVEPLLSRSEAVW